MSIHRARPFMEWVKAALEAGGLAADIGAPPEGMGPLSAYCVIYPIAGGVVSGTIDNPNEDGLPDIQVSSVARSSRHALEQADDARALLLAAIPATLSDGRKVLFGQPAFVQPNLLPDLDVKPPYYTALDRLSFRTAS